MKMHSTVIALRKILVITAMFTALLWGGGMSTFAADINEDFKANPLTYKNGPDERPLYFIKADVSSGAAGVWHSYTLIEPENADNWRIGPIHEANVQPDSTIMPDSNPQEFVEPDSVHRLASDVVELQITSKTRLGKFKEGYKFRVWLKAKNANSQVVWVRSDSQSEGTVSAFANDKRFTLSPRLDGISNVAFGQELADGRKEMTYRLPLDIDMHSLVPSKIGRLYFHSENVIANRDTDRGAKFGVTLGFEQVVSIRTIEVGNDEDRQRYKVGPVYWSGTLSYVANQSLDNQSIMVAADALFRPEKFPRFLGLYNPPLIELTPLSYQRRFRQDLAISPGHAQTDLYNPSVAVQWGPFVLGRGTVAPTLDYAQPTAPTLFIRNKLWYFPNETSVGGNSVHRTEWRNAVELYVPTKGIPLVSYVTASYVSGANEANGYVHDSQLQIGLLLFGSPVNLIKRSW